MRLSGVVLDTISYIAGPQVNIRLRILLSGSDHRKLKMRKESRALDSADSASEYVLLHAPECSLGTGAMYKEGTVVGARRIDLICTIANLRAAQSPLSNLDVGSSTGRLS